MKSKLIFMSAVHWYKIVPLATEDIILYKADTGLDMEYDRPLQTKTTFLCLVMEMTEQGHLGLQLLKLLGFNMWSDFRSDPVSAFDIHNVIIIHMYDLRMRMHPENITKFLSVWKCHIWFIAILTAVLFVFILHLEDQIEDQSSVLSLLYQRKNLGYLFVSFAIIPHYIISSGCYRIGFAHQSVEVCIYTVNT